MVPSGARQTPASTGQFLFFSRRVSLLVRWQRETRSPSPRAPHVPLRCARAAPFPSGTVRPDISRLEHTHHTHHSHANGPLADSLTQLSVPPLLHLLPLPLEELLAEGQVVVHHVTHHFPAVILLECLAFVSAYCGLCVSYVYVCEWSITHTLPLFAFLPPPPSRFFPFLPAAIRHFFPRPIALLLPRKKIGRLSLAQ